MIITVVYARLCCTRLRSIKNNFEQINRLLERTQKDLEIAQDKIDKIKNYQSVFDTINTYQELRSKSPDVFGEASFAWHVMSGALETIYESNSWTKWREEDQSDLQFSFLIKKNLIDKFINEII